MEVLASFIAVIIHYINVSKQLLYTLNLPYVICQLYLNDKKIMQAIACGRFWAFFLSFWLTKIYLRTLWIGVWLSVPFSQRNRVTECIFFQSIASMKRTLTSWLRGCQSPAAAGSSGTHYQSLQKVEPVPQWSNGAAPEVLPPALVHPSAGLCVCWKCPRRLIVEEMFSSWELNAGRSSASAGEFRHSSLFSSPARDPSCPLAVWAAERTGWSTFPFWGTSLVRATFVQGK